jgi:WD40 repeat protein
MSLLRGCGLLLVSLFLPASYPAQGAPPSEGSKAAGVAEQARTDLYGDPLPPGALARLGSLRLRHGNAAPTALAFPPGGKQLVSAGGGDRTLRFWEARTGKAVGARRLPTPERFWLSVTLSADGSTLVARVAGNGLYIWETATGKVSRILAVEDVQVMDLALSASGRLLAAGYRDGTVHVWDLPSGKTYRLCGVHRGEVDRVTLSGDGRLLASAGRDRTLRLWDTASGKEVHRFPVMARALAMSPDGKRLAAGGEGTPLWLWDTATAKETWKAPAPPDWNYALAFSHDGMTLATGGRTVRLWNAATGKEVRRLPDAHATSLAFAPDGRTLASAGSAALRLWDVTTGKELPQRPGHQADVDRVAFAPDGKTLATASWGETVVRLWDAATGRQLHVLPGHAGGVFDLAFSPDGRSVLAGTEDHVCRRWDMGSGKQLPPFPGYDQRQVGAGPRGSLMLPSADSKALISLRRVSVEEDESNVRAWDTATGKELFQRLEKRSVGFPVVLSPDGAALAFTSGGRVVLQDVATGRDLWFPPQGGIFGRPFAFSPDSKTFAVGCWKREVFPGRMSSHVEAISLWELATGKELTRIKTGPAGYVAFSPGGRVLAAAGRDSLRLWEVATGKELFRLAAPEVFVGHHPESFAASLAFAPDGQTLATGLMDATALVWDVRPGSWHAKLSAGNIGEQELAALWDNLGGDARKAHAAVWALVGAPETAVAHINRRLRPAGGEDPERIRRRIAELDSKEFAVREAAFRELERIDLEAEAAMRQVLRGNPPLEVRRRIEALLGRMRTVQSPEVLQKIRAVQVLEYVGSASAREALRELARGAAESRLTRDAKAALDRLGRRSSTAP